MKGNSSSKKAMQFNDNAKKKVRKGLK
jgi:hypothetical protein